MRMTDLKNHQIKEILQQIESCQKNTEKSTFIIAIDGMSGAGKTTLGKDLQELLGGNLFHMDDFFLQPYQRTIERLDEPGGNVDYERFKTEVIDHLAMGQSWQYGIYDCHTQSIIRQEKVQYKPVSIIEGSYSMHPYFGEYADICFFLEIGEAKQRERIVARNGVHMLERFLQEWIPRENRYFEVFDIRKKCLCICTDAER